MSSQNCGKSKKSKSRYKLKLAWKNQFQYIPTSICGIIFDYLHEVEQEVCKDIAKYGYLRIDINNMKFAIQTEWDDVFYKGIHQINSLYYHNIINQIIVNNRLEYLKKSYEIGINIKILITDIIIMASEHSCIDIMKWLLLHLLKDDPKKQYDCILYAIDGAVIENQIESIKFLVNMTESLEYIDGAIISAVKNCKEKMLMQIYNIRQGMINNIITKYGHDKNKKKKFLQDLILNKMWLDAIDIAINVNYLHLRAILLQWQYEEETKFRQLLNELT
jgi:hypothetical protein